MHASKIYRFLALSLLAGSALLVSCNRHFSVSGNQYKEYSIDQQTEVDSSLVNYYLPFKKQLEAEMNRVIGHSEVALTKPSEPETLMGDFFSDAILTEGLKKDPGIQFTLATKGGLRTTFPKGDITVSHAFELMPFENELVILTITGVNAQKVIDFIARSGGQPTVGITMKIKDRKAYDVFVGGKPFDINQNYKLLTYDYLANGGDNLDCLSNPVESKIIDKKVRDAVIDYISDLTRAGKTINTKLDGRIIVAND